MAWLRCLETYGVSYCTQIDHSSFKIPAEIDRDCCSTANEPPRCPLVSPLFRRFSWQIDGIDNQLDSKQKKVYEQRPFAFLQIILAIFAVEVYGNRKQEESPMGGDLGFDPLGLKPAGEEAWERVQLRELKNGRLAMFAILGMIVQEHITGVGVLEKVDALAGLA